MSDSDVSTTAKQKLDSKGEEFESDAKKLKVDSDQPTSTSALSSILTAISTSATDNNNLLDSSVVCQQNLSINTKYYDSLNTLKELYLNENIADSCNDSFVNDNVNIVQEPFRVVQLKNFVKEENVLHQITELMSKLNLNRKNNDLYSLKQSNDLSTYSEFGPVCEFFKNQIRKFIQDLTGIDLNSNVALTVSKYDENDYLLCHDDQLDNRKIAFILYFVDKNWSADDGGQLELFRCHEDDHQPLEVVKKLTPEWNMFNFFEVQPITYHQVGEIKTAQWSRWSINGWFHSDSVSVIPRNYSFPLVSTIRKALLIENYTNISYELLISWINPSYLLDDIQCEIQETFVDKSEIQLKNFLREEKYKELSQALNDSELAKIWKKNYIPILCNYNYIPDEILLKKIDCAASSSGSEDKTENDSVPKILQQAYQLFSSEAFFLVLSNLTGIRLHKMAIINSDENSDDDDEDDDDDDDDIQFIPPPSSKSASNKKDDTKNGTSEANCPSSCRGEVRRWENGHYTLSSNIAPEYSENMAVDVLFFLNVKNISDDNALNAEPVESSNLDKSNLATTISGDGVEVINIDENADQSQSSGVSSSSNVVHSITDNGNQQLSELIEISDDDEESDGPEIIDLDEDDDDEDEEDGRIDEAAKEGGGYITYIDESISDELLNIEPISNCLNIVFRLKGTLRFTKYINSRNANVPFNEFSFVYYSNNNN